jgi:hypothetical protein
MTQCAGACALCAYCVPHAVQMKRGIVAGLPSEKCSFMAAQSRDLGQAWQAS